MKMMIDVDQDTQLQLKIRNYPLNPNLNFFQYQMQVLEVKMSLCPYIGELT